MIHVRLLIVYALVLAVNATAGTIEEGLSARKMGQYEAALSILRPLAAEGNDRAQIAIGLMFEDGQGVLPDHQQAVFWFRKAADGGNTSAHYCPVKSFATSLKSSVGADCRPILFGADLNFVLLKIA